MLSRIRGRRVDPLEGVNLLHVHPVREAEWHDEDDTVVLQRRRPRERGLSGIGARVDHWLGTPRLRLDSTGSFAWRRFDGSTTVGQVVEEVRETFGAAAEPVEQRLGAFVRLLRRERLVSYAEESIGNDADQGRRNTRL
ncbi:MAG: PqqD family protein [Gemmatimonadetes bacterium]|nr:PqqD family protein [Gemmatimonadota bacterium]